VAAACTVLDEARQIDRIFEEVDLFSFVLASAMAVAPLSSELSPA
jgi:hypothetical protein